MTDAEGAALATALLKDLGMVDESNRKLIVNRSKIRLERKRVRELNKKQHVVTNLCGMYFDGKKAPHKARILKDDGSTTFENQVHESLVIVQEPDSKFIGTIVPKSGGAEDITNAILHKLADLNISLDKLCIVGGDGCNTNTGHVAGVMRKLEEKLGRPLARAICLLHLLELLLKKLFVFWFGNYKGPLDFSTIPGLTNCETLPIVSFKKIRPKNFPKSFLDDLSRDQKNLFLLGNMIYTGDVNEKQSTRKLGPLNHARFMTFASRVLRIYMSQANPSVQLTSLTHFIMRVYLPAWQLVKMENSISKGSDIFMQIVSWTRLANTHINNVTDSIYCFSNEFRYLGIHEREVVGKCLQDNCFWAFPENILLSMINSDSVALRKKGLKTYKKIIFFMII